MSRIAQQSAREVALSERQTVLRMAPSHVVSRLPLTPEEGFLLSRIDRPLTVGDLLRSSGLPESAALPLLLSLCEKGAVLLPTDAMPSRPGQAASPYGEFVFSPAELQEDVDLDIERRKLVLFTFHRLAETSHYRLLGISPLAPAADVRKAFLDKSKLFHPDAFFRKRLGTFLPRIEAIFHRLKLAHETLMDDEARRKYDRDNQRYFSPDEKAALVQREIDSLEEEQRVKQRRERLLKAKGFGKLSKARELVAEGDEALGRGDISTASASYQRASEIDPRLDEARTKLAEARRVGQARRADLALDEAARAEGNGDFRRVIDLLKGAAELDPQNSRVHYGLANAILRSGGEPREARVYAQKVIDLGDKSAKAHLLLGEVLLGCGMKKNARRELELAADGGEAERAKPLLKQC